MDNGTRIFIHQKRPPKAGPHHSLNRYGYPSGHTTAATAIGVAAACAVAPDLPRPRQFAVWATVGAVALAVGWSRLYLDEHWLDDVVGGWMAGTAIGLGAASLDESLS
jgi:undecaprenyl-diphosphatase